MAKEFILILGGARSGKSRFAQRLAAKLGERVLFVATGEPLDAEMALRIKEHKRVRPENWRTLEINIKVGQKLKDQIGDAEVVLLDCLTLLVSNIIMHPISNVILNRSSERSEEAVKNLEKVNSAEAEKQVIAEVQELFECIDRYEGNFIVVSNEVGLGLVPDNKLGRIYRDLLGKANQLLAQHASEVYFMVSGMPVKIKG